MPWYLGDANRYNPDDISKLARCLSTFAIMNEKAIYPDEAPPEYTAQEQQSAPPSWKWWWRKRVWMPTSVLILLLVFGVIFGAVMGVKASRSENDSERAEQLFAARGWNSSTRWSSYSATPTYSYSYSWTPTPPAYSTSTYGWYTPSPSPSLCPDCIVLQPQRVPRDISVAAGAPDLIFWDLRAEGRLWKKEGSGSWGVATERKFLVAPVSVRTGANSHIAVSVDASSGRVVYQLFRDGQWGEWQELEFGARFIRRPAVVSRAEGRVDIIAVTEGGHVWQVSYDEANAQWSQWSDLGHDITSEVSATSWGEDRIDVFGKRGRTVMHRSWTASSGWTQDWDDLGNPWDSYYHDPRDPASSAPLAVSWRDGDDGVVDVYMTRQGSSHKLFRNGAWSDWTGMGASHEGYEFPDTQSIVKGDGVDGRPYAHLLSRGTNDCINYSVFNGTAWGYWNFVWCVQDRGSGDWPTELFPTYIVNSGDGKVTLVGRDLESNFLKLEIVDKAADEWQYPGPLELWENLGRPA